MPGISWVVNSFFSCCPMCHFLEALLVTHYSRERFWLFRLNSDKAVYNDVALAVTLFSEAPPATLLQLVALALGKSYELYRPREPMVLTPRATVLPAELSRLLLAERVNVEKKEGTFHTDIKSLRNLLLNRMYRHGLILLIVCVIQKERRITWTGIFDHCSESK